jgi:hypothetical protein
MNLREPDHIQYDICDWLQNGPKKRQVRGKRGVGKSYLTAAYANWQLYRNPNISIIVVSGVANLATDFIGLSRKMLDQVDVCAHLRPGESDKDGALQYVSSARTHPQKDPTVWACGISSSKTGHHADLILCDDIETPENSDTVEKRERLLRLIEELEDLLNPGGEIVFLNTPQNHDSVYIELERRGYEPRRWPSRFTNPDDEDESRWVSPMLLDMVRSGKCATGSPTSPNRPGFDEQSLLEREAKYGPARFAMQMQCDPRLNDEDKYPLKLKDFIVLETHRDIAPSRVVWGTSEPVEDIPSVGFMNDKFYHPIMVDRSSYGEYTSAAMFIDPSGGGATSGDEVGYAAAKMRHGTIYVLEVGGLSGGHTEKNMRFLASRAAEYGIKRVVLEENYGKGMFTKLLAPIMGDINGPTELIDKASGNTQKEKRIIDTLVPLLGGHRIVFDPKVAKDTALCRQITQITYSRGSLRHDDRIEALAGVCADLSEHMPIMSYDKQQAISKEEAAKQLWKEYLNGSSLLNPYAQPKKTSGSGVLDKWRNMRSNQRNAFRSPAVAGRSR